MPKRKQTLLCTNLELIENWAKLFKGTGILETVKLAKTQALAMERRLYAYKETIESLGFKRVRKKYKRA
jgi:hypothetical protein